MHRSPSRNEKTSGSSLLQMPAQRSQARKFRLAGIDRGSGGREPALQFLEYRDSLHALVDTE